jgi:phosphoribosylamine--glycine ligase
MNVFVIGSGGREHALCWKIDQSPLVDKIYCAPGNGGIAQVAECVDIAVTDYDALVDFAKANDIDLTVVGPEAPLVDGIVDLFEKEGLQIFGPTRAASRLEGSKIFAKEFMYEYNIPTAPFRTFDNVNEVNLFLTKIQFPIVIKADGLAAGKGVFICNDINDAKVALDQLMEKKVFREAGNQIVVEECLFGEEISILAVSDGERYVLMESSQDHKRIFDDDLGPNTGGMGAYSPAPLASKKLLREIGSSIIEPTIKGMEMEGTPFKGVLYAGLMITKEGPFVLEFNVRFGDPEIQAILPRMKTDFVTLMLASCQQRLGEIKLEWDKRSCICIVMSSGGYPGKYEKGMEITGLENVDAENTMVFHAGTKKQNGRLVTSGGRVLGVTGLGASIEEAINHTYAQVERIKFDHCFFRRDIGAKALKVNNILNRR